MRQPQRLPADRRCVSGCGSASARTVQPRCVHTAEIAWKVLPSRNTNSRSSGRNFRPSGKLGRQPELHRRRRVVRDVRHERPQRGRGLAASATTPAPVPSLQQEVATIRGLVGVVAHGRVSLSALAWLRRAALRDREPLHRHRVGRAADRAQAAADAAVVVLDHRGERQARPPRRARRARARAPRRDRASRTARSRGSTRGRRPRSGCRGRTSPGRRSSARGRRGSAPPVASAGVGVVAGLDLRDAGAPADVERRRRLAIERARSRRSSGSARSGSSRCRDRASTPRAVAGEVLVDRARGALAVGDRLDQIARPERDVAAGEDARRGRRERVRVDPDRAAGRQLDAVLRREERRGPPSARWPARRRPPRASRRPRRRRPARSGRSRRTPSARRAARSRRGGPCRGSASARGASGTGRPRAAPPRTPRVPASSAARASRRSSRARRR